ncbi:trifunctional transcriptional regulator/proline dehydrogenase/L-glutamate gamma-semialdehyde dehydrogenase [Entomomonas moraniae]|uniref:Bifunctional protein PutA n=1 Tax=Entomomonas moraniae TaxID=2213226 RepID=A0A3S9XDG1_9GAMM|nr:trifunctional transcriptional regulator/proline dehydrogenase/L-glutamate gamma-semialdehyde dehydrogenase [Entomomonas moraniae]AZS50457.1 trifunctional transcriptional regulator/proline dehydrogenase/L-glutamate gamma-semialdehyde dehydrogenase [Entomomonas moraniae]
MASTTLGVKLDDNARQRLKEAAKRIDRTPHWLIKQAIFSYLEKIEQGASIDELLGIHASAEIDDELPTSTIKNVLQPFLEFAENIHSQSLLTASITAAYRRPEPEIIPLLLEQTRFSEDDSKSVHTMAFDIANKLRNQKTASGRAGLVQGLLQEFSLSSQEGVALMCLAEALLRIPDKSTRDALIRDKISKGNWQPHLGKSQSMFVNAATWGLLITGRLTSTHNETKLTSSLNRIIGKSGEPLIRKGVDMAMRMMGEQFVTGETIGEALANASKFEAKGFRYSYDMLGEAALTKKDADDYFISYEQSIHAIGKASNGRGIYEGPGISIKLSALHPRYSRAQYDRVMNELYPKLLSLTLLAKQYDVGINIDAEEADRLELSLELLEKLCFDTSLVGWNGIGFVIQAYQKRCPYVIDYVIDLARRSRHRLMIRLVKGAYWDSEIKRAQELGLEGYPVYTRKCYTDISYLACARKLLAVPEVIFPQFATHNAHTLSAIYHIAGKNYYPGQYEFQCLHGMGEPLYEQIVGKISEGKYNRPCRIYAPVGTHETLLAYLVRRLLENGANTSFVNRVADQNISINELIEDPVQTIEKLTEQEGKMGLPHPRISLPENLYGNSRTNSKGIDLSNENRLASLSSALLNSVTEQWVASPILGSDVTLGNSQPILNPANNHDVVGQVYEACEQDVEVALTCAESAFPIWQATPSIERASILERIADQYELNMQTLIGIIVREAGKTYSNAIAEVREAIDFLRYYAEQVKDNFANATHRPLGTIVCISPWNFPMAIFTGQVAAALAAGNTVIAKPAEQTPLIAAQAIRIMLAAGIPKGVLQLLPGTGETVGAKLTADPRVKGIMFTGSTDVAKIINKSIAGRLDEHGHVIPLIAETGGQNAMIVDSSALVEQVVIDVLASAFDSAGQRCSALRVLCIQEDIADRTLEMLKGAMNEYQLGNPELLSVDIGPVIDHEAKANIDKHIENMRVKGNKIYQAAIYNNQTISQGTFVVPTIIELNQLKELKREIFGPVLHVIRYNRNDLDNLLTQINELGYGLTLGIHTRIDETISKVIKKAEVGNIYVNRNIVGAVVGVQPFGGEGLSGTGPKAGGPLYLYRLLATKPDNAAFDALIRYDELNLPYEDVGKEALSETVNTFAHWLESNNITDIADLAKQFYAQSQSGTLRILSGPTGERDTYELQARKEILCLATNEQDLLIQLAAIIAIGAKAIIADPVAELLTKPLPEKVLTSIKRIKDWAIENSHYDAVLYHGDSDQLIEVSRKVASKEGAIASVHGLSQGSTNIPLERLSIERSISVNTAAAGGNASLMTIS